MKLTKSILTELLKDDRNFKSRSVQISLNKIARHESRVPFPPIVPEERALTRGSEQLYQNMDNTYFERRNKIQEIQNYCQRVYEKKQQLDVQELNQLSNELVTATDVHVIARQKVLQFYDSSARVELFSIQDPTEYSYEFPTVKVIIFLLGLFINPYYRYCIIASYYHFSISRKIYFLVGFILTLVVLVHILNILVLLYVLIRAILLYFLG